MLDRLQKDAKARTKKHYSSLQIILLTDLLAYTELRRFSKISLKSSLNAFYVHRIPLLLTTC